jgi:DNA polymerase-1
LDDSYWIVSSHEEARRLLSYLQTYDGVSSVDTETRGWNVEDRCSPKGKAFATCVTISTDDHPNIYLDNYGSNEGLIHILTPWLEDGSKRKVLHNAKFDMHVFANHGIELRGLHGDTMVMDFLLDTSARGQHDLETVYHRFFGVRLPGYKETFKENIPKKNGEPSKRFRTVPHYVWWERGELAKVIKYACKDTRLGLEVFYHHEAALAKVPWVSKDGRSYLDYYRTFELPYTEVLFRMERRGVRIDMKKVKELREEYLRIEQESMEAFFSELSELGLEESYLEKFNPNSGQQLGELLFEKLGLPVISMTKSGKSPAVDEETLETLSQTNTTGVDLTFLKKLLEARKASKNRGTYADYIIKWAPQYGGKIHTSFDQIGAETARLSSKQPNLQNIPIRTALGKLLRDVFVAGKGEELIDADYSQIEVRMMAHRSGDPTMKRFVENDGDQHSLTAWAVMEYVGLKKLKEEILQKYGTDPEAKKPQPSVEGLAWIKANHKGLRDSGKTMNFAIQYGAGEQRAASVFGIPVEAGKKVIDVYFDTYEGLGPFMAKRRKQAAVKGYIRTMFGRYCHLPHASGRSFALRKRAERQAVNYDIQGSARDVIMAGMLLIDRDPVLKKLKAEMVLQVHDELLFTVPKENMEKALTRIKEVMEDPYSPFGFAPMSVKTVAEIGHGLSWGTAH